MIVKELCNHDVLLGRGTGPNEHEGNIRFRLLAAETLKTFSDSTTSPSMKMNKTKLAKKILEAVKARGGRFLRKLSKDEVASFRRKEKDTTEEKRSKDMFVVVPYEVALDKAKQSFRHQRRVLEQAKGSREPAIRTSQFRAALVKQHLMEQVAVKSQQRNARDALLTHLKSPRQEAMQVLDRLMAQTNPMAITDLSFLKKSDPLQSVMLAQLALGLTNESLDALKVLLHLNRLPYIAPHVSNTFLV